MREQTEAFQVQFWDLERCSGRTAGVLRILMVLKGEVQFETTLYAPQNLQKGQIQVINPNTEWRMTSQRENIVVIIDIAHLWLFNCLAEQAHQRFHITDDTPPHVVKRLGSLLCRVATLWLKKSSDVWLLQINKSLLDIFGLLLQNCKTQRASDSGNLSLSPRIAKALVWIEEHYRENISLQQLAEHLHVSAAHLSRQFTQETGDNFRTRLMKVRLQQSAMALVQTNDIVAKIAAGNGFNSLQRFNTLFRQQYAMSPGIWRAGIKTGSIKWHELSQHLVEDAHEQMKKVSSVELFSLLVQTTPLLHLEPESDTTFYRERICLTPGPDIGKMREQRYIIAVGSFSELLKQHVQQQLLVLKQDFHSIQIEIGDPIVSGLDGPVFFTGERSPTWSPWSGLDLACQFIYESRIAPVIKIEPELGELSFTEYSARLMAFLRHNCLLLGEEFMQCWSFILDIDKHQLLKPEKRITQCETLYQQIRQLLPESMIGMVWHEPGKNGAVLPASFFKRADFIGVVVTPNDCFDLSTSPEFAPLGTQDIIHRQLEELIQSLRKQGITRPLYLQSWSTLTGNTLMINGLFFRGALLMEMLLSLPSDIQMLGMWLNSALQNEVGTSHVIENNSLSLFFNANTRRPIFHVLALKQRVNGAFFASGHGWIATRRGEIWSVLLLNPVTINPQLSVQEHLLNDYSKSFTVQLTLPVAGTWRIKKWLFDQKNGALYYQYGLHPTRYDRDAETMAYINRRSEPTLSVSDEKVGTQWTADVVLDINAVCLIQLCWIAE